MSNELYNAAERHKLNKKLKIFKWKSIERRISKIYASSAREWGSEKKWTTNCYWATDSESAKISLWVEKARSRKERRLCARSYVEFAEQWKRKRRKIYFEETLLKTKEFFKISPRRCEKANKTSCNITESWKQNKNIS